MLQTSLSEIELMDNREINNNLDNCEVENIIVQTKATVSNVNVVIKFLETERKDLKKQLNEIKSEKKIGSICAGNIQTNIFALSNKKLYNKLHKLLFTFHFFKLFFIFSYFKKINF